MIGPRVGIDVGGTKCLAVVLDATGGIVREERRPTPRGVDALIATLADLAREMGAVDSLGIGVPGLVSREGVLLAAPNLIDVGNVEVRRLLAGELGFDVRVDNDATCAMVAEWRVGAAVGLDDVVMVTMGTGIGGGIVAGGRLVRGTNGFAGEIGHMVVDPVGPPCPCGRRGCGERYASGTGLAALARTAVAVGGLAAVVALAGGSIDEIRGEHVQAAAQAGDAGALAVVDDFARWVALGLVNLTNALDPAMFVLGGGLATDARLYLDPIRRWFHSLLYSSDVRPHPVVRFGTLGERSGAVGAALLGDV
ncbi:MAG: ROK family protein [Ilumatobacteraceae bacterium]